MHSKKHYGKIKYPKLLALLICIALAYAAFRTDLFKELAAALNSNGSLSIFLAGFLFAYGFTAPFAVGFFISLAPQMNIFIAAPLAGFGALMGDFLIFQFIRTSFRDEFNTFKLTRLFRTIRGVFDNHVSERFKQYILWTIAGLLIASPLPDEFGVSLISGFTKLNQKIFGVISYSLNTLGIFVILWLAR